MPISVDFSDKELNEDEEDDDILEPSSKRRNIASQIALKTSLELGLYTEFLGKEGPVESYSPDSYNALDYLKLFWPDALTSLIANETNRYARQKVRSN